MEWMKKNGPLALGIGLPVLLIVFFALAAWIPALLVASPKYDLLFLTNYNDYGPNTLRFTVRDRHVSFTYTGENYGYNWPKLYRYSPASGALREIPIPVPASLPPRRYNAAPLPQDLNTVTPVPAPEVEALALDTSTIAPDGYEFRFGYGRSPGLAGELFFSSGYRNSATLSKGGRVIRIPTNEPYYGYSNIKFIGWVIP